MKKEEPRRRDLKGMVEQVEQVRADRSQKRAVTKY